MAKCKKHGELDNRTIIFTIPTQTVAYFSDGEKIEGKIRQEETMFCLECVIDLLKKKIGTVQ